MLLERRLENDVERVERRILLEIAAQQIQALLGAALGLVGVVDALRDEREISRVLALDALPRVDRRVGVADARARGRPSSMFARTHSR